MTYPIPSLGYYAAECCLLDLYLIENETDLANTLARIEENDECGALGVCHAGRSRGCPAR